MNENDKDELYPDRPSIRTDINLKVWWALCLLMFALYAVFLVIFIWMSVGYLISKVIGG